MFWHISQIYNTIRMQTTEEMKKIIKYDILHYGNFQLKYSRFD